MRESAARGRDLSEVTFVTFVPHSAAAPLSFCMARHHSTTVECFYMLISKCATVLILTDDSLQYYRGVTLLDSTNPPGN